MHQATFPSWIGTRAAPPILLKEWKDEISRQDGTFFANSGSDVYEYLIKKVLRVVNNVRSPGQPGWAFLRATAADCIACVVWADGTHNQETPLKSPQAGEPVVAVHHYSWLYRSRAFLLTRAGLGELAALVCPRVTTSPCPSRNSFSFRSSRRGSGETRSLPYNRRCHRGFGRVGR